MIEIGKQYVFNYPSHLVAYPDYTDHAGQVVGVVREPEEGLEYDDPGIVLEGWASDKMFEVMAPDGWEGRAWASELAEVSA